MRLRTIPPKSDLPAPQYDGIANARKLKSFIMADLFSYYAYKCFSLQHFSSDSSDEEHSF